MKIKLPLPELYRLSEEERAFVRLYNDWGFDSSTDPIKQFRSIKNPQGLDLIREIELINEYLEEKFPNGYSWKKDSWIRWIENWLKNAKRRSSEKIEINLEKPFYMIMVDHYLGQSVKADFSKKHDSVLWFINKPFQGCQRSFLELTLSYSEEVKYCKEEMDMYDYLDMKIQGLIKAGAFIPEYMSWLAIEDLTMLIWIMDWTYGPEKDRSFSVGNCAFEDRRNRKKKVSDEK